MEAVKKSATGNGKTKKTAPGMEPGPETAENTATEPAEETAPETAKNGRTEPVKKGPVVSGAH